MKSFFLRFLLLLFPIIPQAFAQEQSPKAEKEPTEKVEEEVADYVRYSPAALDGDPDVLQTAVTRFQKGQVVVDLVAAVHLGDADYFKSLNTLFESYDAVLYELVGGKFQDRDPNAAADPDNPLSGLSGIQGMASKILGLEFQLTGINYDAPNFVHADVDHEQFQALMAAKNESLSTLMTRAMDLAQSGKMPGLPTDEAAMSQMMGMLMTAVMSGDSATLKRTIAPFLSESEALIAQMEGDDGTVLVGERNKVVMTKLSEVIAENSDQKGKFAIFYGAGHMPDLEERLIADGYTKGTVAWANAWKITDTPADPSAPAAATNLFQEIIGNNPEILNLIQELGKAVQEGQ